MYIYNILVLVYRICFVVYNVVLFAKYLRLLGVCESLGRCVVLSGLSLCSSVCYQSVCFRFRGGSTVCKLYAGLGSVQHICKCICCCCCVLLSFMYMIRDTLTLEYIFFRWLRSFKRYAYKIIIKTIRITLIELLSFTFECRTCNVFVCFWTCMGGGGVFCLNAVLTGNVFKNIIII